MTSRAVIKPVLPRSGGALACSQSIRYHEIQSLRKEQTVSSKEMWIMAAILGLGALYLFETKALYLFGLAALIYLFTRASRR